MSVSVVHQNLYLSTFSKCTTSLIPGIVSKTFLCVGSANRTLLCDMPLGFLVSNLSQVAEIRAIILA